MDWNLQSVRLQRRFSLISNAAKLLNTLQPVQVASGPQLVEFAIAVGHLWAVYVAFSGRLLQPGTFKPASKFFVDFQGTTLLDSERKTPVGRLSPTGPCWGRGLEGGLPILRLMRLGPDSQRRLPRLLSFPQARVKSLPRRANLPVSRTIVWQCVQRASPA